MPAMGAAALAATGQTALWRSCGMSQQQLQPGGALAHSTAPKSQAGGQEVCIPQGAHEQAQRWSMGCLAA